MEDALRNVLVGDFRIDGLMPTEDPNEILCRMHLDLDGILEVTALEKRTGASKHVTIANALRAKSAEEISAGQRRIRELYESRGEIETAIDAGSGIQLQAASQALEELLFFVEGQR